MPGPVNFNTADRIIRGAMREAGLLQRGEDPNSDEYAEFLPRLNDLVNLLQTQGLKLWLNTLQTVPLVAGTQSYVLGPGGAIISTKPVRVLEGYYFYPSGNSFPLNAMSWNVWNTLSNKTQQGALNSYFVDKQQLNTVVWFWQTPDVTAALGSVKLLVQQQIVNSIALTDAMGFPQEWFIALRWLFADEICGGQSEQIMNRCRQKAQEYRMALEDWDVEDADVMFVPDMQGHQGSSFR